MIAKESVRATRFQLPLTNIGEFAAVVSGVRNSTVGEWSSSSDHARSPSILFVGSARNLWNSASVTLLPAVPAGSGPFDLDPRRDGCGHVSEPPPGGLGSFRRPPQRPKPEPGFVLTAFETPRGTMSFPPARDRPCGSPILSGARGDRPNRRMGKKRGHFDAGRSCRGKSHGRARSRSQIDWLASNS